MSKRERKLKRLATIKGLLARGTSGNLSKLSMTTLNIAQGAAPKETVKKHSVRSGGEERKTITSGAAKAEIRRRGYR